MTTRFLKTSLQFLQNEIPRRLLFVLVLLLSATTGLSQERPALRIVDVIWGFDDRVVVGQFVPLSILIDNVSSETLEGKLVLNSVQGVLNSVGGDFERDFFISPASRQWVQFYPYVSNSNGTWSLTLQTAEQEFKFDPIPQSRSIFQGDFTTDLVRKPEQMTAVILDSAAKISRIPGSIKHMPEEIFPPYSTATHSLYAMFLDHNPDWDVPRQESCMAWLRRGGRLHLLRDSNNLQIQFSGVMAALNEPQVGFLVGHGLVTRHDYQRENLPDTVVNEVLMPQKGDRDEPGSEEAAAVRQLRGPAVPQSAAEFFEALRTLTAPDHNWFILTLLALMYIGLLFPGSWMLSKNPKLPFYITYAAIGGGTVLFSIVFLFFGRRGYGESTAVNSLMIARHETDNRWHVFGMTHVFVTAADEYSIEDNGHEALLASGSESERVSGSFSSGNSAKFVSLMPPFSSQPVMSQRRIELNDWKPRIRNFDQSGSQLTKLTIETTEHFPSGPQVTYRILHGRTLYSASYDPAKRLLTLGNSAQKLETFGTKNRYDPTLTWSWGYGPQPVTTDPELVPLEDPRLEVFRQAEPELLAKSLVDDFVDEFDRFETPAGEIRLLVYAPIPPAIDLPFSAEANRDGRVLFVRPMQLELSHSEGPGNSVP